MMSTFHRGLPRTWLRILFTPCAFLAVLLLAASLLPPASYAQEHKPNILVIFGDDIGQANISRYTHGVVGYSTPNIDSIGAAV